MVIHSDPPRLRCARCCTNTACRHFALNTAPSLSHPLFFFLGHSNCHLVSQIHQEPFITTVTPTINKQGKWRGQSRTNHRSCAGTVASTGRENDRWTVDLFQFPCSGEKVPAAFSLNYLSSRNPEADVFHSHNAFVRKVVDLCEILELHHVKVSFARLHPVPLCLDVSILFSCGWQKWCFPMYFVKQEPTGRAESEPYPLASRQQWACVLGIDTKKPSYEIPGHTKNTQKYRQFLFSPDICSI